MPDQNPGLREYLEDLLKRRAALDIQISGALEALGETVESLNGQLTATPSIATGNLTMASREGSSDRIRSDQFFRMTVPEAIQAFLEIKKQPQTPKAIADGLEQGGILSESKHFYANVFTALKRLRKQGLVVNTRRGWGLAEWYAGRSGVMAQPTKPKRRKKAGAKSSAQSKTKTKVKKAKDKGDGSGPAPVSYRAFVGEQIRAGKTMSEAAAAWKVYKSS